MRFLLSQNVAVFKQGAVQTRPPRKAMAMADSTLWWLLAGAVVALELFTGTFYLLMLALGMAAGALAAHAGAGLAVQLVVAAGVGAQIDLTLGRAVPTYTGLPSDAPVQGRFTVRAVSDGRCVLKGAMMTGLTVELGASACLEIDGVLVAVVSGKMQLLDRELLRMVGITPEAMKLIVVKSSNHFRADFTPIAARVIVAKAAGPMAADPAELPWKKLPATTRRTP
mgnify:CR=1 FL=1